MPFSNYYLHFAKLSLHHLDKMEHFVGPLIGIGLFIVGFFVLGLKMLTPKLIYLKTAFVDVKK